MESAGTTRSRDDTEDTASDRASKRQRGLGSGGRGAGYSPPEVSFFLSLLEEHLPVTNREWKTVVRLHNQQFPSLKRTPNSLRRKFSSLCRSVTGADETGLSPDVRRAVLAKRRMKNRGDVPEGDEVPDSDEDDENEDDVMNGNQRRRDSTGENAGMQQPSGSMGSIAPVPTHYYAAPTNGQAPMATAPIPMAMQQPIMQPVFNNGTTVQPTYDQDTSTRRSTTTGQPSEPDLIELIKMQLLQNMEDDRRRRLEDHERREEERRHREEERAIRDEYRRRYEEERARRVEDLRRWEEEREESRRRHEEFMQVILTLVTKKKE